MRPRGLRLFVRQSGRGWPLVMLNGIGANSEMWGAAEARLARGSRTIVLDAPGTGRSSTPLLPLPMSSLGRTLWEAVDELGYERVDVLGFSFGGVLAQQMAHTAPERIRRLALVSTACGWGSVPGDAAALALVATPVRYYSRTWYERTKHLFGDADAVLDCRLGSHVDARLRYPPSLLGYAYELWAGLAWSSLPWIGTVAAPTLVLAGERDRLVPPANSVQLARRLGESRLHLLRDEGHLVIFDPGSRAHSLLADFFSSVRHDESEAWSSGTSVDDDEAVEAALRASRRAQPLRALSEAFRRGVAAAAAAA